MLQGVVHRCLYKSWKPDNIAAALGRLHGEPLHIQAAFRKANHGTSSWLVLMHKSKHCVVTVSCVAGSSAWLPIQELEA